VGHFNDVAFEVLQQRNLQNQKIITVTDKDDPYDFVIQKNVLTFNNAL